MKPHPVSSLVSKLGEGPLWDPRTRRLYWIDIAGQVLNWLDEEGAGHSKALPGMPGTVVLGPAPRGVVLALDSGVVSYHTETGVLTPLASFPDGSDLRFNDGKVAPDGSLWVGTMDRDGKSGAGTLYRWPQPSQREEMLAQVSISNGLAWSADGTILYFIDSPLRKVQAFDIVDGRLSHRRNGVDIPEGWGWPDGMTMDGQGNLWVAHWDGGCVACYDPATGEVLQRIDVPAPLVTSCAFGGPDLTTLYITTAQGSQDFGWLDLAKHPLSGRLFACTPGVQGRQEPLLGTGW